MVRLVMIYIILFLIFPASWLSALSVLDLTIEEKVGQLIIAHFSGEHANEESKRLVQEIKVGGIIYYNWSNGLASPEQIKKLSDSLQNLTRQNRVSIPLFISIDQEGGLVSHLNEGFTIFPGNRALAMAGDSNNARICSRIIGQEMRAVGINLNFSPVVDVNSNPKNPIIGLRSFGETAEVVVKFGKQALKGARQAGMISTLKHYPGHGDVEIDSHEDLPVLNKTLKELETCELLPFLKLAKKADAIMTAHLLVPAFDEENCSTLSKKTLKFLREEIGFSGVIISDSLMMQGVLKKYNSPEETAIQAFNAGCDILLLGGKQLVGGGLKAELKIEDIRKIHKTLVDAVKSGCIQESQLNESVARILLLKEKYLNNNHVFKICKNSQEFANKVADQAIRVTLNKKTNFKKKLGTKSCLVIAPESVRNLIEKSELARFKNLIFFNVINEISGEIENLKTAALSKDILIVCTYNAWKDATQSAIVNSLFCLNKKIILIILRDPIDKELFNEADVVITTFSPTFPSINSAFKRIMQLQ